RGTVSARARSLAAGIHNNRGLALAKLGRHEEALGEYGKAIEEERACFEAAPEVYQYRKWLSLHIDNMGKSLRALGRVDEAYATYRDRMKLWADGPPEHRKPRGELRRGLLIGPARAGGRRWQARRRIDRGGAGPTATIRRRGVRRVAGGRGWGL